MVAFSYLVCAWALVITHAQQVCGDVQFLERQEGESVSLPCALDRVHPAPFGMYLKRGWLQPGEVLFMYTKTELTTAKGGDKNRTSASGDPSERAVNVTISQLRVGDTDRYRCEFVAANEASADHQLPGRTDFFLLVTAGDAGWPVHIDWVQTCVGGSALVPCPSPNGEHGAVEGAILKRRRSDAPAEVLYDSRRHHGDGGGSSSSSQFPAERVRLTSAPGPAGFTHNLSVQQLRLGDSGLYSCQLLQRSGPDGRAGLGRHATFVSVAGQCGCPGTPALLYPVSAAAVLLLLLLCLTLVVLYTKSRRGVKGSPQPSIYEEMARVEDTAPLGPRPSVNKEYRRYSAKKSAPENYYETPSATLRKLDQE